MDQLFELAIDRFASWKAGRTGMWREGYARDKKRYIKEVVEGDLVGLPSIDYEEVRRFFIRVAFPVRV